MYERLPSSMKAHALFCLYRLEERGGRKTKVPYQVNGARAKSTDRKCFTNFALATKVLKQGGYDGLGVGIFDDLIAIDIDHCIVDGKLSDLAADVMETLKTYAEISPSGDGIHVWLHAKGLKFAKSRYYIHNQSIGMEVYPAGVTNKYVTITGNALNEYEVNDCTEELQALLEKYMLRSTQEQGEIQKQSPGSFLSDESVLEKMFSAKNGEKTKLLWEGNVLDGKSHSEADMALCSILAFWCGGDLEQMDRLFRQSKLMRTKWDEQHGADTYGNITMKNAVSHAKEFYSPINISTPQNDFNELVSVLTELDYAHNSRFRQDDMGSGRLFAEVFKDIARYVPERKKWYIYDGTKWYADIGSLKAMELCKDLADAILLYATKIHDEHLRKVLLDSCKKWNQRRHRETFLKDAQSVYPVLMEKFDTNRYLFNCKNGTLDLVQGEFREHRSNDFITKISPVYYDELADCPRFAQFIDEITSGDKDTAKFLQKILGYAISGDTRYECMMFLYGETTRNGKGTLMESILRVMGDYGKAVRPETIAMKTQNNSSNPTEDIARLAGIRMANISEPSRGLLLNAAQVKSMTGNDTLNARFLHENSFDFSPQFKLYVNTNYLPVITDMTLFSSGRVLIIPFNKHFEEWEPENPCK